MISFLQNSELLLLEYQSDHGNPWAFKKLIIDEDVSLKNTYTFSKKDLNSLNLISSSEDDEDYDKPLKFIFGHLEEDYYKIKREILGIDISIFFHRDIKLTPKYFTAATNISIFKKINEVVKEDIYIGGKKPNSLSISDFKQILKNFPNTYEMKKYVDSRLSSVLSNYFDSTVDGEKKYITYMNKKISKKGLNLSEQCRPMEIEKYELILGKLEEMLKSENSYNEKQWQTEILQIILLLYPKYIYAFTEVPVKDTYNKKRRIDLLLIDSSGNIDIIEIKKPFDNCIVSKKMYRNNYIPIGALSGTIMQIEKYIFYLNKWGKTGEEILTKKYKEKLTNDLKIKITNPSGLIIMGRENNLSRIQREDFEVIKRKYKNIIDILTYDDLLNRLKFTIKQLKKEA